MTNTDYLIIFLCISSIGFLALCVWLTTKYDHLRTEWKIELGNSRHYKILSEELQLQIKVLQKKLVDVNTKTPDSVSKSSVYKVIPRNVKP